MARLNSQSSGRATSRERPRYRRMRSIFLRLLGLVYLSAFWSLGVQVDGLIGSQGILPVGSYLSNVHDVLGAKAYWLLPTLLWFDSSDASLHGLCWAGAVVSGLLMVGFLPVFARRFCGWFTWRCLWADRSS